MEDVENIAEKIEKEMIYNIDNIVCSMRLTCNLKILRSLAFGWSGQLDLLFDLWPFSLCIFPGWGPALAALKMVAISMKGLGENP